MHGDEGYEVICGCYGVAKMNILSFGTIGPFGQSEDWTTRDARGVQNKRYFECKPSREI